MRSRKDPLVTERDSLDGRPDPDVDRLQTSSGPRRWLTRLMSATHVSIAVSSPSTNAKGIGVGATSGVDVLSAARLHETPLGSEKSASTPDPTSAVLHREAVYRRMLASADAVASLLAILLALVVTHYSPGWTIALVPPFAILVFKVQGLYDRDDTVIHKSTLGEWRGILESSAMVALGISLAWRIVAATSHGGGMRVFAAVWLSMTLLALIGRDVARRLAQAILPTERCLIVGDQEVSEQLAVRIDRLRGVEVIGGVNSEALDPDVEGLRELVRELHVHRLVLAEGASSFDAGALELVRSAKWIGVRVSLCPGVLAAVGGCATFDELDGMMLLGVPRFGLSRSSRALKRAFDLAGAAVGLLGLSPLFAVIAVMIKLDSRGRVLFRQMRVGRDNRPFEIVKFRSMVVGADAMKNDLLERNEAEQGLFKIAADPRVTRVGRWIRRMHLDELPQLWNVIHGEMSLVGPRPLIQEEDRLLGGSDRHRLRLTPGMTGPWQVRGPMTTPLPEMAKLDYLYVSNWSLWTDIDILLRTAVRVLERGGH